MSARKETEVPMKTLKRYSLGFVGVCLLFLQSIAAAEDVDLFLNRQSVDGGGRVIRWQLRLYF